MTTLASDRVALPIRARRPPRLTAHGSRLTSPGATPTRPWLRWNDYGIGLFQQGDLKGAARAWTRVAELAPDKPDGPLNRARAEIAEGRLADARASLDEAERRRPGWGKTAFFRATVAKDEGRLDDAQRDLKSVLEKFPLDRVAWNNLGLVEWLAGRFPDAVAAYRKVLDIDSEDLNAHYNLMRVYRAMGDRGEGGVPRRRVPPPQGGRDDPRDRRRPAPARSVGEPRVAADPRPRRGRAAAGARAGLGRRHGAEGLRDRPRLSHAPASAGPLRARAVVVRLDEARAAHRRGPARFLGAVGRAGSMRRVSGSLSRSVSASSRSARPSRAGAPRSRPRRRRLRRRVPRPRRRFPSVRSRRRRASTSRT